MDFFEKHSEITLLGLIFLPRLTLVFGGFVTGGLLWWMGWLITPHLLVAILSLPYWESNPILVIGAWILAAVGTGGEARTASNLTGK
jgi:hypothetical protein